MKNAGTGTLSRQSVFSSKRLNNSAMNLIWRFLPSCQADCSGLGYNEKFLEIDELFFCEEFFKAYSCS
jgi:hypothetical protein